MNIISVGMTTYNSSKYVEEQLLSIIKQTKLPDEIVVFDDCSTDNTIEILYEFKEKCKENINIIIHVNEKNVGVKRNFEACFLACSGNIIFSCDADDVWLPNKIEEVMKAFTDESVVYVYHDYYVTDSKLSVINEGENISSCDPIEIDKISFLRSCILHKGAAPGMSIAFRKDLLSEIVPFLQMHDAWIALTSPLFGKIIHVQDKLIYYRRHEGTTSTANMGKKALFMDIFNSSLKQRFYAPSELKCALEQYVDKFDKRIPDELKEELVEQIETSKELSRIPEVGRIKGVQLLFKLLFKGRYLKYRGNYRTFALDLMCVIRRFNAAVL